MIVRAGQTVSATAQGLSEVTTFDLNAEINEWKMFRKGLAAKGNKAGSSRETHGSFGTRLEKKTEAAGEPPSTTPLHPKPQPRLSEDNWQSIHEDASSLKGLPEEPLEGRKKPKGHSTKYGF